MTLSILMIGGGNMGSAMAIQWHRHNHHVTVVEPNALKRAPLEAAGIRTLAALEGAPSTNIVVFAIKPQQFDPKLFMLHGVVKVSIMAGIPLSELSKFTSPWARVMPNLPATIGESMSVGCSADLEEKEREMVVELFGNLGSFAWVKEEEDLHAVTAISGSGPAYLFAFMEAMQHAAIAHGLPAELASKLIRQTMRGAALLADGSSVDFATLREQVTSKGGTTEAALKVFEAAGLKEHVGHAIDAAMTRSMALAKK